MTTTTRKKILFVLHTPPPVHGAAMVGKIIQDSHAINDAFDCRFINLSTSTTVESVGRFSLKKIGSVFSLRRRIRKAIREFHPDLVYYTPSATGFAFWKDCLITRSIKRTGTPVVYHFHNKGVSTKQGSGCYDRAYRRFFSGAKVMLLAEALYDDMKQYVSREQLLICGNGIADVERKIGNRNDHDAPQVLFLSNLIAEKGVLVLLDACQILRNQGMTFRCHIVGSETEEINSVRIRQEIDHRGLNGIVEYLGKRYGEEKEAEYDRSDIFVFPTFYSKECFPIVLLEAMQHGLPCISTREGGIADIVDDGVTGLLAHRRDADDLAAKMATLISDTALRKKMGAEGRRKYERMYTLQSFEQNMISCLKQVL